ncbi:hypothetical protein ACIGHB_31420 [Streptomyces sp. NPDC085460]|uniref:hypothetical protein n=1 Tax=Streptomyces sp. NPDC085460 TaxID=3365723 RepID=UPI0037D0CC77
MSGRHRRAQSDQPKKRVKTALMAVKVIGAVAYTAVWCWKLWTMVQQPPAGPWC